MSVEPYDPFVQDPRTGEWHLASSLTDGHDRGAVVRPLFPLRWYNPLELASVTLEQPDWIAPGFLLVGGITEIDGKIKAAGKTTLILFAVRAILDGAHFLGQPTRQAKVLYVTEQSRQTFADALRRAGLDQRGDELRVLFREDIGRTPWPDVVEATRQDGYDVAVFDTIGKLAGIRDENAAPDWSTAMTPLQDLAASGRAVIIARHDRKGGGDVGDSGRGSSQASGDVDIILALRRPEGNQGGNRRVIETLSRYPETPDKVIVELGPEGYVLLGSDEAVATREAREFVSVAIGSEFQQTNAGITRRRLVELGSERDPKVKEWAVVAALDALVTEGHVQQAGRGVARDPFLYSPSVSVETEIPRSTDRHSEALDIEDEYPPGAFSDEPAPAIGGAR